jgi:rhodanese-related sulfurtransferase
MKKLLMQKNNIFIKNQTGMLNRYLSLILMTMLAICLLSGCGRNSDKGAEHDSAEESAILLAYLEENGNLINSDLLPSLIDAELVYENLDNPFYLIIDLRTEQAYQEGHIKNAVHVRPQQILDYFENHIDPNSFQAIILYCNAAFQSAHVNTVLALLGYDNVFTLRYGLSSWDQGIAEKFWLGARSNHLEGRLDQSVSTKLAPGRLPSLATGETEPYRILRARAQEVLGLEPADFLWSLDTLEENREDVYLVSYWPVSRFEKGHLPGSVQYTPKQSLHSSTGLHTLPADKPVVIYCYTHTSAFVTTFLRLLGYDAYNMPYGANAFIHHEIATTEIPTRSFSEDHVRHFPLEEGKASGRESGQGMTIEENKTPPPVAGGC